MLSGELYQSYIKENQKNELLKNKLKFHNQKIQDYFREGAGFKFLLELSPQANKVLESELIYAQKSGLYSYMYFRSSKHLIYRVGYTKTYAPSPRLTIQKLLSGKDVLTFGVKSPNDTYLTFDKPFEKHEAEMVRDLLKPVVSSITDIVNDISKAQEELHQQVLTEMLEGKVIQKVTFENGTPRIELTTGEKIEMRQLYEKIEEEFKKNIF